jgi:LAGLIDADG DNA endonuclease family
MCNNPIIINGLNTIIIRNPNKRFYQIELTMSIKQVILGSILGDGSLKIAKNYKNARYSEQHSIIQKNYLMWKFSILSKELGGNFIVTKLDISSFSKNKKVFYQSKVNSKLTELHVLTHKKNKKLIKRSWLNCLQPLALAIWWCDDGSLTCQGRQGVLCTDSFSFEEQKIIVKYLKKVWQIECIIFENIIKYKNKVTKKYRIRFASKIQLEKFLTVILPYIPVSNMLYKIMICYKDPKDQQRWISKVRSNLPQFSKEIELNYEKPFNFYKDDVKLKKLTFFDIFRKNKRFETYILENDIVQ